MRTIRTRRITITTTGLVLLAASLAPASVAGASSTHADDRRCTIADVPPGQMISVVAPFDGSLNPGNGNPDITDLPLVPYFCHVYEG